jgi:hypothetical protein
VLLIKETISVLFPLKSKVILKLPILTGVSFLSGKEIFAIPIGA